MSNRRVNQAVQELFRQVYRLARSLTRSVILWLMRTLMLFTRRPAAQGFVLPTVTMVSLVVIVLTGAMIIRSYDRSRNATNVRVDQAVLNAGAPAIDRARAKLAAMFEDPSLPRRGTPNDLLLQQVLAKEDYTFADEIRLKMVADFTNDGGANNSGNNTFGENARPFILSGGTRIPNNAYQIFNDESSINAWKFPVDTDSNGRFDAYTLYALNYRIPRRNNNGEFLRARSPLDARTPPMDAPAGAGRCASTSGAASVTGADWYSTANRQTKSFFIYTVTVPIADGDPILTNATLNPGGARYEAFRRQAGFSALETQQDYARIAVNNNAILFEDDLSLSSGPPLRISGRVFTNSNMFLRGASGNLDLFQVSSPASCFYKEENSKIVVGGNVKKGAPGNDDATGNLGGDDPGIHLYRVPDNDPGANDVDTGVEFVNNDRSTNNSGSEVSFNSLAYNQRIALLVEAVLDTSVHHPNNDPTVVTAAIDNRLQADPSLDPTTVRREEFEIYFRNRTRRVPNIEVNYLGNALVRPAAFGGGNYTRATVLQGTSATDQGPREQLRPPTNWMFPFNYFNNTSAQTNGFTGLTMRPEAPAATDPAVLRAAPVNKEQRVGDRLLTGNNMPALWYLCDDGTLTCNNGRFVGNEVEQPVWQNATTRQQWTNATPNRIRRTQAVKLDNLDTIARDSLWETEASMTPQDEFDNSGGVRIIVGAGIFERQTSFLPPPPNLANRTCPGGVATDLANCPSVPDDLATNAASTATDGSGEGNPYPYTINENLLPVVWPDTMPMSPGLQVYNNDPTLGAAANRVVNLADPAGANIQNVQALTTTQAAIVPTLGTATGTAAPSLAATPYTSVDPNAPKYSKGDLRMRAAVAYHYRRDPANPNAYTATPTTATLQDAYQTPIACISSYYDPTTPQTARNRLGLPDVSGGIDTTGNRTSPAGVLPATTIGDGIVDVNLYGRALNDAVLGGFAQGANAGKSNNGVVYAIDPATHPTAASVAANNTIPATALPNATGNNGMFGNGTEGYRNERSTTLLGKLYYQANLVYPNGRFVNEPLRQALYALGTDTQKRLTLSQQAAIDAAICSLRILGDPVVGATPAVPAVAPIIPHGAIKEVTLLDPRQPKAVDGRFIRVQSASATASAGMGTGQTYTITYTIPPSLRPNWGDLDDSGPSATLDDGNDADEAVTALTEIFDTNATTDGDVLTVQGFESVNPLLNAKQGVVTAIDDAAGTITVRVRGNNPAAIPATPAPNATAGITDTSTAELDMPLEDRQPSEVRVTQLDLNLLRTTELLDTSGTAYDPREFMIPNSGIVYVSRDDAQIDLSDVTSNNVNTRRTLSPVDFRVDATRRIGGVMLINGSRIDRISQYRDVEKGLVVATNLAGYVQADTRVDAGGNVLGNFNLHADPTTRAAQQEFTVALAADWNNFYTRTVAQVNNNFACRPGGLNALCTTGDSWRTAVLLADGFSPLSRNYRTGYRSDGSFDLNNNEDTWTSRAKRLKNGFFTNAFAINGLSGAARDNAAPFNDNFYTNNNNTAVGSTYFNNYVTPVQRRSEDAAAASFPAYVMEICRKSPVSECTPNDWVMGYDLNGDGDVQDQLQAMRVSSTPPGIVPDTLVDFLQAGGAVYERDIKPFQLGRILTSMAGRADNFGTASGALEFNNGSAAQDEAKWDDAYAYSTAGNTVGVMRRLGAGTTGVPALELGDRRFARRVAFARDQAGNLVFSRPEADVNSNNVLETSEDRNRNGERDLAINVKPIGVGCPLNINATPSDLELLGCYYRQTTTAWGTGIENGIYYGRPGVTVNNLFFRTTNNLTGNPGRVQNITYQGGAAENRPLYIMDPAQGGTRVWNPPILENKPFPASVTNDPDTTTPNITVDPSLSDKTLCVALAAGSLWTDFSNQSLVGNTTAGTVNCPAYLEAAALSDQIGNLAATLTDADDTATFEFTDMNPAYKATAPTGWNSALATTPAMEYRVNAAGGADDEMVLKGTKPISYYALPKVAALPGAVVPGGKLVLKNNSGNPNAVIILRGRSTTGTEPTIIGGINSVSGPTSTEVILDGYSPNNVFWVFPTGVTIQNAPTGQTNRIVGNLLGRLNMNLRPNTSIAANTQIQGRILGFGGGITAGTGDTSVSITALGSSVQPSLVPVLQYTATKDDPDNGIQPSNKGWQGDNDDNNSANRWRQAAPAVGEIYNLILAVGNNPGRTVPRVEGDGGIGNFPRFLENWDGNPLTINGGLIQIKRSVFTTGGDRMFLNEGNFTNPANWTTFGYFQGYKTGNSGFGNQWGVNATYQPPNRLFGFDPGILSQLPDLFTEQFSIPEPVKNEFFQQLDRSDRWVQALLCATQPGTDANTPLAIVGTTASTPAAYFRRVGVPTAATGDIPYRYPAIPLNNPFRPNNTQFCPRNADGTPNFTQYPTTCLSTGTGACN